MKVFKELWNKFKGLIVISAVGGLLGFGVVTASLGLEVVDGPDGAVCIKAATVEPVVAPVVVEPTAEVGI